MTALLDVPGDNLIRAVTECVIHDTDFPTLARLRDLAVCTQRLSDASLRLRTLFAAQGRLFDFAAEAF